MSDLIEQKNITNATWHGLIWRFLERCSSQVVSFIVSIILARLLLPEQYGLIAMTMIFISLFEVFVTTGLGSALIQKSKYEEKDFSTMFWASIIFSLIIYGCLFFLAPYISQLMHTPGLTLVLRVLGLRLPISAMNSIQQAYVSQQMIFKKFFFSTLSGTITSGIIGLIMAYAGYGVWALVGQNLTMVIVNTIVLHFLIPWRPTLYFSSKAFWKMYGFSWRVMATGVIGTFFDQLRNFFIGRYYTPTDLAFVNRGSQFPNLLAGNISTTLQSVLFPAFSYLKDDKVALREAVRKAITIGGFFVAGLMAVLAGTADSLIDVLLTNKWARVVPYLQCVCLLECFGILGAINLQTIKATGHGEILLKLEFIKKPVYFLLIIIGTFINPFAIVMANTIYNIIGFLMNAIPNKNILDYRLSDQIKDIISPILLGIAVFGALNFVQKNLSHNLVFLCLESFIGLLMYFFIARLLHFVGAEYCCQVIYRKFGIRL